MSAGGDGRSTVLFLTDAQVKDESFIEDVNTLINSGDLPNLYSSEEKTEILEKMQSVAKVEVSNRELVMHYLTSWINLHLY